MRISNLATPWYSISPSAWIIQHNFPKEAWPCEVNVVKMSKVKNIKVNKKYTDWVLNLYLLYMLSRNKPPPTNLSQIKLHQLSLALFMRVKKTEMKILFPLWAYFLHILFLWLQSLVESFTKRKTLDLAISKAKVVTFFSCRALNRMHTILPGN